MRVGGKGEGGDENFAGYARYPIARFSHAWGKWPAPFHWPALAGASLFHLLRKDTLSYRALRFEQSMSLPFEQRYVQYVSFFTEEEKRALYRPGFGAAFERTDVWYARLTAGARERGGRDTVHRAMSMDIETYLADDLLPKVDLGSMAHGLEARSPFLDHELLELTARIPSQFKLRGQERKWILKRALRGIVPDATLDGPKRGFRLPLDAWFRGDLRSEVTSRLLNAPPAFWDIFEKPAIERFLQRYYGSRIDYSDHVWALLWLQEWCRQYA